MTAGRKIYAPQFEFAVRYIAVRDIEGMGSCWQDILGDHLRRRSGRRSNVSGAHTPDFFLDCPLTHTFLLPARCIPHEDRR
jgi:hypothetical protein